jgi:predicted nucleic acid-binding protein
MDNSILDVAADIYTEQRKMGYTLDDADIFIAAFCKCHSFTLVSNNVRHFVHISDLSLTDWTIGEN